MPQVVTKQGNFGADLIVDIEYKLQIVFVVWFGTHAEYDKIDVKRIGYEK